MKLRLPLLAGGTGAVALLYTTRGLPDPASVSNVLGHVVAAAAGGAAAVSAALPPLWILLAGPAYVAGSAWIVTRGRNIGAKVVRFVIAAELLSTIVLTAVAIEFYS